ncbi:GFA family protein [Thalassovita taeanensis]|uniref:GFA family protein n=1 Tax=Thalassovita taeanensis TaxID=657014 RepID=UPI000B7E0C8A|nr:GFA family protein [Thalassovita taeanensis]
MTPLSGSCLCAQVRFEITGPLTGALNCHCSMCRKSHGAAFRSRAALAAADFHWLSGESLVSRYESSEGEFRCFCSICGANLITEFSAKPNELGLALGVLDDAPDVTPQFHIFVGSKAPWHKITDDLPQWDGFPDPDA